VKVFKQKVKHLLYEQENSIAEIKAENMVALKVSFIQKLSRHKCETIKEIESSDYFFSFLHEPSSPGLYNPKNAISMILGKFA
jgi:hypothetical protein